MASKGCLPVMVRLGVAVEAWRGVVWQGWVGRGGHGVVWRGKARPDVAWFGGQGMYLFRVHHIPRGAMDEQRKMQRGTSQRWRGDVF